MVKTNASGILSISFAVASAGAPRLPPCPVVRQSAMSPAPTRYAIVGIGVGGGIGVGVGGGVGVGETGALELPPHAYASNAGTISSRSHALVPIAGSHYIQSH